MRINSTILAATSIAAIAVMAAALPVWAQASGDAAPATLGFIFGINADKLFAWATAIVAAASLLANLTSADTDNKIVALLKKALDFCALNFRK